MQLNFYKSLDRPIDLFGVKGGWITVLGACAGISALLGLVVGAILGIGFGVSVAFLGVLASFLFCIATQDTLKHRDLPRLKCPMSSRCVTRRETLTHIINSKK